MHDWTWESPDRLQTPDQNQIVLSELILEGDAGQSAKHNLRDHLRADWWAKWAPLRPCLDGAAGGIHRELSWRPVQCMRAGNFQFGNDGMQDARFVRLLANTMWSSTRLKHAGKISSATCPYCGRCDENTLHALCDMNLTDRIAFSRKWHGTDEPFAIESVPKCLYIRGLVPLKTSPTDFQISLMQCYLSNVLARWNTSRFNLSEMPT